MIDEFLHDLQKDIFNKEGYYLIYLFVFFISFTISVEQIRLFCNIFRFILCAIPLLFLSLVHFKCKDSRNKREDKIIIESIILFLLLTVTTIYNLIKDLN